MRASRTPALPERRIDPVQESPPSDSTIIFYETLFMLIDFLGIAAWNFNPIQLPHVRRFTSIPPDLEI